MADTRPYPKSGRRNILDASNLASQFGEDAVICAPISVLLIARSLVAQRALWRTTYAVDYGNDYYTLPDLDFMDDLGVEIARFLEATNEMNCNDLVTGIADIVTALGELQAGNGCGCGSGGAGSDSPEILDTDTGDITETAGTPPSGYPNWTEYQEKKCDVAYWIVDNMRSDLSWLSTANYGLITTLSLASALLSFLSSYTLLLLLPVAKSLNTFYSASWTTLIDILDNHQDDLICAIMSGETASGSQSLFLSELYAQIDTDITDGVNNYIAKQLVELFTDTSQFNLLYAEYDDILNYQIPGGNDCTSCGVACHNIQVEYGEYLGLDRYRLVFALGEWRCQGLWNADGPSSSSDPPVCGTMEYVTITDVTGHTHSGAGANDFRLWEDGPPLSIIYDSDTPPIDTQFCARKWALLSGGTYDCTIERGGHC